MSLFDPSDYQEGPAPTEDLSADQKRTRRRRQLLDSGTHPATRVALLKPNPGQVTCGDCEHAVRSRGSTRYFWKCDRVTITRGPGTDIRVSWPACVKYEPRIEL